MKTIYHLAISRLKYNKGRSILTIVAIALMTTLLMSIGSSALTVIRHQQLEIKESARNYHAAFKGSTADQVFILENHADVESLSTRESVASIELPKLNAVLNFDSTKKGSMLQKGFNLILVNSLREAKHRLLEDKEIELILCDLSLPDGTALELFHDIRRISEKFKVNNPPIKLLPFFILTASTDLATEYQYRHEGVSDYITAPVNIPELIRRILFFVE